MVLKVTFIKLLLIASRPFLTPLAKSFLRRFACLFYAEEKTRETKSNLNYVSSFAKKLGVVLQTMPKVQESQGFKTLHSDLAVDLEKFCAHITKEYVLKPNDMNVEAKRTKYHFSICKWICGLAGAFIAQQGVTNHNEDVAVMDLLASAQDEILASLTIPLQNFLAAYKAANNLLGRIPTPTVTCNFEDKIDHFNDTPCLEITENAIAFLTAPAEGEDTDIQDYGKNEQEMINATNAVKTAAIGGRATICHLILDAINKGTIEPIKNVISNAKRTTIPSASKPHSTCHVSTSLSNAWPP
jgi:hypothetical protein